MKLLLDTCTFLWAIAAPDSLSPRARDLFQSADNEVFLSSASAWEIATKHALGRLPLPAPVERFVPELRERFGIETLSVDEETTLAIARLQWLHRDPFDRVLVAQSIVHGMPILTPDRAIAQYPVRAIW